MPALHIHDVARIAHGMLNVHPAWNETNEATRQIWRDAAQHAHDGIFSDGDFSALDDQIGDDLWVSHFVALVEACLPYLEES